MAFVTQVLANNKRNYIVKVTGAAAEAAALLVDVSAIGCSEVVLEEIQYDVLAGSDLTLLWDATSDVAFFKAHGHSDVKCFEKFGGIYNDAGAGVTGDVNITTTGTTVSYWFIARFRKIP
jgi:hypothetical protein